MKKRALFSLFLVFLMVFSFSGQMFAQEHETTTEVTEDGRVQITLEFEDAEDAAWAVEYIGKMKSKNVLAGYQDGTFRPNQNVNRAEAIVTAVRLMGLEEQAKQKSLDTKLHFKDANLIDKQYKWAKGYILVALENGLFDTSEDAIQPNRPASRIWVASLLVRALGLQSEALSKMTVFPNFSDASSIPAGAVGYINVAAERGIVSGYPDNSFQPNKNVTRAEMAAFLDRTNDGLLEEAGAITVTGTVKNIEFKTVSDSVYTVPNGTITIESFNGDALSYGISSDLLVQYEKRFITADQLLVGDAVSLVVKETQVVEANLISKEKIDETISGVRELDIEVELGDDEEYKLKYKNKKGKTEAEIEHKFDDDKEKLKGKEAVAEVEAIVKQLALTPEMSKEEIVNSVLAALKIESNGFSELEIEIKFSNGTKVEIEIENEDFENEDKKEEDNEEYNEENTEEGYAGIQKFELKIKLHNDDETLLKYENEDGRAKAEVKMVTEDGKEEVKGRQAVTALESLLDSLSLSSDMDKEEVLNAVLSELNVDEDVIKKVELKVEFSNDEEIEIEFKNDEKRD